MFVLDLAVHEEAAADDRVDPVGRRIREHHDVARRVLAQLAPEKGAPICFADRGASLLRSGSGWVGSSELVLPWERGCSAHSWEQKLPSVLVSERASG